MEIGNCNPDLHPKEVFHRPEADEVLTEGVNWELTGRVEDEDLFEDENERGRTRITRKGKHSVPRNPNI